MPSSGIQDPGLHFDRDFFYGARVLLLGMNFILLQHLIDSSVCVAHPKIAEPRREGHGLDRSAADNQSVTGQTAAVAPNELTMVH